MAMISVKLEGPGWATTIEVIASNCAIRMEMEPPKQYLSQGSEKWRSGGRY